MIYKEKYNENQGIFYCVSGIKRLNYKRPLKTYLTEHEHAGVSFKCYSSLHLYTF